MNLVPGHNADIGVISVEDFVSSIQHFRFLPALKYMQEATLMFENKIRLKEDLIDYRDPPTNDLFLYITRDAHAFVTKSIILHASLDAGEAAFTRNDYKWLIASFYNIATDLTYLDPSQPDAYKYIIRVENSQFRYWNLSGDIAGRYLIMFSLPDAAEINLMCQEKLGLSFFECVTIGTCIWADMRTRKQLNIAMLVSIQLTTTGSNLV